MSGWRNYRRPNVGDGSRFGVWVDATSSVFHIEPMRRNSTVSSTDPLPPVNIDRSADSHVMSRQPARASNPSTRTGSAKHAGCLGPVAVRESDVVGQCSSRNEQPLVGFEWLPTHEREPTLGPRWRTDEAKSGDWVREERHTES